MKRTTSSLRKYLIYNLLIYIFKNNWKKKIFFFDTKYRYKIYSLLLLGSLLLLLLLGSQQQDPAARSGRIPAAARSGRIPGIPAAAGIPDPCWDPGILLGSGMSDGIPYPVPSSSSSSSSSSRDRIKISSQDHLIFFWRADNADSMNTTAHHQQQQ